MDLGVTTVCVYSEKFFNHAKPVGYALAVLSCIPAYLCVFQLHKAYFNR